MSSHKVIAPHLNSDEYKAYEVTKKAPSYFDYIRINSDGMMLVGCSELTGRYWNGCAYVLNSQNQNVDEKYAIHLGDSTADGCFIKKSDKVLLCHDSGTLSVWAHVETAWEHWDEETSLSVHDDVILAIDCLEEGDTYVTVGADTNLKVWDVNTMACIRNYERAHGNAICDVSVRPNSTCQMVTSSLDQTVSLWDDNVNRSVQDVAKTDCGVRCVRWINEHTVVLGNDAGVLYSADVRKPCELTYLASLPISLHRLLVKPQSNHVVVCCDNRTVTVFDVIGDKAEVIYNNKAHSNFVRGLAWDVIEENCFLSVGWDGTIKKHKYI